MIPSFLPVPHRAGPLIKRGSADCFIGASGVSGLTLLKRGVVGDHHDAALALNDLAFLTDFLDRRSDFHLLTILSTLKWGYRRVKTARHPVLKSLQNLPLFYRKGLLSGL